MRRPTAESLVRRRLADCGLEVDGPADRDPRILDERVYGEILERGSLGAGEAYMDGWWTAEDLPGCLEAVLRGGLAERLARSLWIERLVTARHRLSNRQVRRLSGRVAERHYDLPPPIYERMLGPTMQYTCAYWDRGAADLEEAQQAKMDLVCDKLDLAPGMRVLELGAGWGALAHHMVTTRGVEVVAVTNSAEQCRFAVERYACPGLEFHHLDYRDYEEPDGRRFDRVAAIGLIEHVGRKNFEAFFSRIKRHLEPHGRALVHGMAHHAGPKARTDRWLLRYIFPGGEMPRLPDVVEAITQAGTVLLDLHNLGSSYAPTLGAWLERLERARADLGPGSVLEDDRFFRMWRYYLSMSIAAFRVGTLQVYQYLLALPQGEGGIAPSAATRIS